VRLIYLTQNEGNGQAIGLLDFAEKFCATLSKSSGTVKILLAAKPCLPSCGEFIFRRMLKCITTCVNVDGSSEAETSYFGW